MEDEDFEETKPKSTINQKEAKLYEREKKKLTNVIEETISRKKEDNIPKLCYMLKHDTKEIPITIVNEKMECPICQIVVKNVQLHFRKKAGCCDKIELDHFNKTYEDYRKQNDKVRNRIKQRRMKERQKEANQESFNVANRKAVENTQKKKKEDNIEEFNLANIRAVENTQKKKKEDNLEEFNLKHKKAEAKSRKKRNDNVNEEVRLENFNRAVLFGPIFICSCCSRRLFENGVTKITPKFKEKMEKMKPGFYNYIINEVPVHIVLNGIDDKSGLYICYTCKKTIMNCKIPSMAVVNGLQLTKIEEGCHLTL